MSSQAPTRRIVALLEYDGTAYKGLQRQLHTRDTVQGRIEETVAKIGATDIGFVASGRTDTGVHALGQVAAFAVPARMDNFRLMATFQALLPDDIRIRRIVDCPDGFSPRFDAIQRTYHYRLSPLSHPNPLERHFVSRIIQAMNPELVGPATALFAGVREMKEWRASVCQAKRTLLNIDEAHASPPNAERSHWLLTFAARSFLHHQVRLMVGGVVAVASGKLSLDELRSALEEGRRPAVVAMQSATGLCLARVRFPEHKDPFIAGNEDRQGLMP